MNKIESLGNLVEFYSGVGFPNEFQGFAYGDFPFAKVSDISKSLENGDRNISAANNYVSGDVAKKLRAKPFPKGTIVFAKIGEAIRKNRRAITAREMLFDNNVMGIYPKAQAIDVKYLVRFLDTIDFYQLVNATSVPSLRKSVLGDLQIPLPPLDEQKRIAAILDKADQLRQKRRKVVALLDSLRQSIFLEMFGDPVSNPKGWKTFELADVADFFAGNSLPAGVDFKGQEAGYLLLKVSDLNRAENVDQVNSGALFSREPGTRAGTAPTGAIVFPKRGGAIATNKKRILGRPAILDPNLMGVAPKPVYLNSPFLATWFRFLDLVSISSGSSVPQLNKQDLAPLRIHVPSLQLQAEYGVSMMQLSKIASSVVKSLDGADLLFTSFQQRAFTGQL